MTSDERSQDQLATQADITCKAIEAQLKGRCNPKESQIIANQCKIDDISEVYIRTIMGLPEKRRKSSKYK